VPNAKHVVLGRTAMDVNLVLPVNTAMAVTLLLHRVEIVQPVFTTTLLVKVLVCPVYRVNSTIKRVP
jgi:hypothetical protein